MIAQRMLIALGFLLIAPGCGLVQNSTRTLILEPLHYCNYLQEHRARAEFRAMARDAWYDVVEVNGDELYSPTYAEGFEDGFSDYLFAGGTGEPPPVPPRKYWKNKYATAEGRQMIEDWYTGFRHGATAAESSGCRHLVEVPSSVPCSPAMPWGIQGEPERTFEIVPPPPVDSISKRDANREFPTQTGNSLAAWHEATPSSTPAAPTSFLRGSAKNGESTVQAETRESRVTGGSAPKQLEIDEQALTEIALRPVRLPTVSK